MRLILLFLLLFTTVHALEEAPLPNTAIHTPLLFSKVNPITGEYVEDACDLVVAGCEPLSVRRFYNHMAPKSSLYGQWRLNPESLVKANFEYPKIDQNVMIGDREGGCSLLNTREGSYFRFNAQGSFVTSLSAHTHPKNMQVSFHRVPDPKQPNRFEYRGEIIDGSGRRILFNTVRHRWLKKIKNPKDKKDRLYPDQWTPFYCRIDKEFLPNGNIIWYSYQRWGDDKYYPQNYRLLSMQAYNYQGQFLGSLHFEYPEKSKNNTNGINIGGSDGRTAHCEINKKVYAKSYTVINGKKIKTGEYSLLQMKRATSGYQPMVEYTYDDENRLIKTQCHNTYLDTHYANGKVASQYTPLGLLARYVYHSGATEVYDGENNLTIYRYDANQRLTALEKYLGGVLYSTERNVWDGEGQLLAKTLEDTQGIQRQQTFTYDSRGNILSETLTGNLTGEGTHSYTIDRTYSNDGFNLLASEKGDVLTEFTYKPGTNLLLSEKTLDKITFYTYDASAVCIEKRIEDGLCTQVTKVTPKNTFPCFGLPEEIQTDTHTTRYTYHPSGKILKEEHFDANGVLAYTLENTYDAHERLISRKDPYGTVTHYTYDPIGNLLSETTPHSHTTWTYLVNLPIAENRNGFITEKAYDSLGRVIMQKDPHGITRFIYDALSRLIEIHHPDGGIEKRGYDVFNNLTSQTDPNGFTTYKKYTLRGQVSDIEYPDGTHEHYRYTPKGLLAEHAHHGVTTHYIYDAFDHLIQETREDITQTFLWTPLCKLSEIDGEGIVTTYTYDTIGRKTSEIKDAQTTFYNYDSLGRLTHTQVGTTTHIQEFDFLDRLIEKRTEEKGLPVFQEKYAYDTAGNQTHVITCQGVTQTEYNPHKQPIIVTTPEGYTTTFQYSYHPFTKLTTDALGKVTKQIYDPCQRLKEELHYNPHCIHARYFEYDLAGNKIQEKDHIYQGDVLTGTFTIQWFYGPCNRLQKMLEETKETHYQYEQGRLATFIKPDTTQIHYTYDGHGRLSTLKAPGIDYVYTYDKKHRLLSVGGTQRTYDSQDHVIEERLANGYILKKTYQDQKLKEITYPDTTKAHYHYDGPHLSVTYKDLTTIYTNNLHTKPTTITLPNNLGSIHIEYDASLRWKSCISPYFSAIDFTYDPVGNLTHYLVTDALGTQHQDYTYDPFHQLVAENTHTYTYDSLNNRLYKDEQKHTVNTLSQLIHDGEQDYIYDLNGNLIQAGENHYTYDALDRLTHVNNTHEYIYDAFNRRITKKTPTTTIHYLWDDKKEIGTQKELRILGQGLGAEIGAATLHIIEGKSYVPLHDHRGNLVSTIDLQGNVIPFRYTAFGEELTSDAHTPWRFSSKRHDPETGYVYFGRRYYAPVLGRWVTPDPRGFEDGPNLYAYVHNNPLLEIDFYGELGYSFWDPKEMAKAAADFAFPCASALYRLPANAPAWKRGALMVGGGIETALLFAPPLKAGFSLVERSVIQIGRSAMARAAERNVLLGAQKTAGAAERVFLEKGISKGVGSGFANRELQKIGAKDFSWKGSSTREIQKTEGMINSWLGEGTRLIKNKAGDSVFLSRDGIRRVRFDFINPKPHLNPHMHVEHFVEGEWVGNRIYPVDVPHN